MAQVKIRKIFHTYHPDFVQDGTEPRGYRLLPTGRWVVEWDIYGCFTIIPQGKEHHTASFVTEEEAIEFEKKLHSYIDTDGFTFLDRRTGELRALGNPAE